MPQVDQVSNVIRKIVQEQLAPAHIQNVSVAEDVDYDGEPILKIDVVFEGGRLDPKSVAGLVRHLRKPLHELDEDRFPLFSFMRPDEIDDAAA